ncbi:uncharacterized protein LOC126893996 isoform X1 [Daktulosphaira vitifoliae]|uniref:uncharacterized protein LOC126893996 isoform X1 n=1 Tax=Daktulosphaira vitifoliae TaxID=58002 RepID=UPI0021A9B327|nr:uncharacterized protein LOC126893996 isoform X1 [Daktulosphaira vitifoliae]
MSSDVCRRSAIGGKKMRKRKELDALTGTIIGNNNKSRRLMYSSESDSCSSSRAPTPIKLRRQITRRRKSSFISNTWCSAFRMSLTFGCILWVMFVTYTFLDIRKIQLHLQSQLDEVAAGNLGVPDDLQKCHAMSKQLQQNQTVIRQHVIEFKDKMDNLTQRIEKLQDGLSSVEGRIPTIPLTSPGAMRDLSKTVASFGSEIKDISNNVNSLKESSVLMQSNYNKLQFNITAINNTLSNLSGVKNDESFVNNMSEKFTSQLNNLSVNLTSVNSTLTSKFDWVSGDQKSNRVEIEKLKENSQRLISQVKTIESECQASKDKINKLSSDVDSKLSYLKIQIENITENVTNLHVMSKPENISKNSSQLKGTNINSSLSKP